ncbi:MAG: DUF4259 domain-containing protein [Planctomycetota bacterium]
MCIQRIWTSGLNPFKISEELRSAADSAIQRILGPESELVELWDAGGRNEAWHNSVDDLRKRING